MNLINNHWVTTILAELIASALLIGVGFIVGKYRERRQQRGRSLDEYDFYPYAATPERFAEFNLRDFRLGVHFFLRNRDVRAARQLIFIGEQNHVQPLLGPEDRRAYEKLMSRYRGAEITNDSREYLENYRNIVRLLGRTFQSMGIELLLHDLTNPTHSIVSIEGAEVTGRALEMGTTTLLVDLKKRQSLNQDKLNYELVIGARRFKCTTIPIIRKDYGVIGALCINIDINYIRDEVLESAERIHEFFRQYCRIDMRLDENILSKDEYQRALQGKKHFRDNAVTQPA